MCEREELARKIEKWEARARKYQSWKDGSMQAWTVGQLPVIRTSWLTHSVANTVDPIFSTVKTKGWKRRLTEVMQWTWPSVDLENRAGQGRKWLTTCLVQEEEVQVIWTSESERSRIQITEALKIFNNEKHNILDMCGFVARTTRSTSVSITVDAAHYHFLIQSNFASQSFKPVLERRWRVAGLWIRDNSL